MKLTTRFSLLTLVSITLLASSSLAAGTCTAGSCGYCNDTAAAAFCSTCIGKALKGGSATKGECSGAVTVANCGVETWSKSAAKVVCSSCDSANNYHTKTGTAGNITACVKCDRKTSWVDAGVCKVSTVVANCGGYSSSKDACSWCSSGYFMDAAKTKCEKYTAITDCSSHSGTVAATVCNSCTGQKVIADD